MAKFVLVIEDLPGNRLDVKIDGTGLAAVRSMESNSAAQNAALYFVQHLLELGLVGPDDIPPEFGFGSR